MHIPNRLQECRDPSAMCAPICLYYFRCTYRTGCKNAETAETRATCICVHLYLLLSWILYMFVFHFMKSAKFSSTHWNEFHFSKMKRFDVPSFFCDPIISHVLKRSQDRMHFKSSCSLLCVYRVQWGYYLCLKMQWCCDDSSTLALDALTERCPSKTSSILSHVSRFKTKTRWILNYSAGLSTLRHFKSPSTSFNTSRSVAGQRQGQRFFQWSDFCHCRVPGRASLFLFDYDSWLNWWATSGSENIEAASSAISTTTMWGSCFQVRMVLFSLAFVCICIREDTKVTSPCRAASKKSDKGAIFKTIGLQYPSCSCRFY